MRKEILNNISGYKNHGTPGFEELAMRIFQYQASNNPVYAQFLDYLNIRPKNINTIDQIPFLPVSLFKNKKIKTGNWKEEKVFESSATTGMEVSKHYIRDLQFYYDNARFCFESFTGDDIRNYKFYALLPSYLERQTSSLVFMINRFIDLSGGGFYRYDYKALLDDIAKDRDGKKIILIGVTFALLDMAEKYNPDLSDVIVMETGGMKGRKKESPREEIHAKLKKAFNLDKIYSEYGMTELLSQCYSAGDGIFETNPMIKIIIKDIYDPFSTLQQGRQGKINIIDLANVDTCSFLATDDLGMMTGESTFKVLGRTDESDIRGCNLLFY